MVETPIIKQFVIDAFNQDLFERDTGKDTPSMLGFIYDRISQFTITISVTDETLHIRSNIDLKTPLATDKDAIKIVRGAIKAAGVQVDLYIDNH
jgi:hypothetical protein